MRRIPLRGPRRYPRFCAAAIPRLPRPAGEADHRRTAGRRGRRQPHHGERDPRPLRPGAVLRHLDPDAASTVRRPSACAGCTARRPAPARPAQPDGIGGVVYLPVGESGPVRALRTSPRSASSMFAMIATEAVGDVHDEYARRPGLVAAVRDDLPSRIRADAPASRIRSACRPRFSATSTSVSASRASAACRRRARARTHPAAGGDRSPPPGTSSCWSRAATRCRRARPRRCLPRRGNWSNEA